MFGKNEEKFLELISKIPNVAVQGYSKERKVIYWNKASEGIYGYTQEEAYGKYLEDLIIPDFMKDDVISHIKNWYEKDIEIPAGVLPLQHKNGSTVHVYSSHIMLNKSSENPELFCVDIDLTEQKRQEEQLKEKDLILQEQSKMAEMGQMLENISHQWKQPLQMVSSTVGGIKIQKELEILEEEYLLDSLDSIEENIQYMSHTIDDFRNFFKGKNQKLKYNILSVLEQSLNLLEGVVKKNQITIHYEKDDFNIEHFGYPNNLIQVIINLANNAKDTFNERNIKNRDIFITINKVEQNLEIKVKDNANGIEDQIMAKIFEPHFTTKESEKGTGIGLSMSKKLIEENMNGNIYVNNTTYKYNDQLQKGAEFTISLPL